MVTIRRHVRNTHINSGLHPLIGNTDSNTGFSEWLSKLSSHTTPAKKENVDPVPAQEIKTVPDSGGHNEDDHGKIKRVQEKFVLDIFAAIESMTKEGIYISEIDNICIDASNKPSFTCKKATLRTDYELNQEATLVDVERTCVRNIATCILEKYSDADIAPPKTVNDLLTFLQGTPQLLKNISDKLGTPIIEVKYPSFEKITNNTNSKANELIYTAAYDCRKLTSEICARAFPDSDIELWFAAMDISMRLSAIYIPKLISLNKRVTLKDKKETSHRLEKYCLLCPIIAWYYLYNTPLDEAEYLKLVSEYQLDIDLDIDGLLAEIGNVVYDPYWYSRAGENIEDAVSAIVLNRGDIEKYFTRDNLVENIPTRTPITQIINI